MKWEDCVKRDVAEFYQDEDWRMLTQNCDGWKQLCLDAGAKRP